jgi:hypothetical protein
MHSLVPAGTVPRGDRQTVRRAGCAAVGFLLLGPIEILTLLGMWSLAMAITAPTWSASDWLRAPAQAAPQNVANAMDSGGGAEDSQGWAHNRPRRLVDDFHIADSPRSCDVSIRVRKTIIIQVVALSVEKLNADSAKSLRKTALAGGVKSPICVGFAARSAKEGRVRSQISRKSEAIDRQFPMLPNLGLNLRVGGTAFAMGRW